jgi:ubiquinone/menaquinone biosynthesis C-methylase UbiE
MMHERRFSGDIERLRSPERVQRLEVERVTQACLEGGSYHSLLDAGTGSGLFAERFARAGLAVSGIDASFSMLTGARGYVPQGRFTQAVVEALPFASGSFDLLFYGLVLHEADDPLRVVSEARRVSRRAVCIIEWPYREQSFGPPMEHRLSPEKLEGMFARVGFPRWDCLAFNNVDLYRLEV